MNAMKPKSLLTALVIVVVAGSYSFPSVSASSPDRDSEPSTKTWSATEPTDHELTVSVRKAISRSKAVDMSALTVRVRRGVVTLAGSVPDEQQASTAVSVARRVRGVKTVRGRLTVQKATD